VKSKKQGASASADSANDAVPGDETVRMPLHFINGTEFKGIDVGDRSQICPGAGDRASRSRLSPVAQILGLLQAAKAEGN
jgi:hypothetical protein